MSDNETRMKERDWDISRVIHTGGVVTGRFSVHIDGCNISFSRQMNATPKEIDDAVKAYVVGIEEMLRDALQEHEIKM